MEIILVRHGQSEADILHVHEGRADFSLTELGRQQAESVAKWLVSNEKFDKIISSPLKRAYETATFIAKASGLEVHCDPLLMEWDNGLLQGLSRKEAALRFPEPSGGRKPHHTFAETESMIAFRARLEHFWSELKEKEEEGSRLLVVGHGGSLTMLMRAIMGLPMETAIGFGFSNTSVHKLICNHGKVRLEYVNGTAHIHDGLSEVK